MPTHRSWSLEKVVAELQRLHAAGESLTYAHLVASEHSSIVTAAERYAGSFAAAVKLAGFDYQPVRRPWTAERILAELEELHAEGSSMNSMELIASGRGALVTHARKHFGGWRRALDAAGVPRFVRGPWKSWELVAEKLRELHARGTHMTLESLKELGLEDLSAAARVYAGSWNKALARCEIPAVQKKERWSRERVIRELQAVHERGVSLSSNVVIDQNGRKLVKAATAYFGSWTEACQQAIETYRPLMTPWTEERVLREIRTRHRAGKSVRSTDVQTEFLDLYSAARRLGLSWPDAVRKAGVPARALARRAPKSRVRRSDAELVDILREAAAAGQPLTRRSFDRTLAQAIARRFGSWEGAMRRAGLVRQYRRDREAAAAARLGGAGLRRGAKKIKRGQA